MNRITNEQREGIVRKAVAERDAILASPAPSDAAVQPVEAYQAGTVAEWRETMMANLMGLADEYAHLATEAADDEEDLTEFERMAQESRDELEDALRAVLATSPLPTAPAGARHEWMNDAAIVLSQFIHLSSTPDTEAWANNASRAIRLLNDPAGLAAAPLDRIALSADRLRELAYESGMFSEGYERMPGAHCDQYGRAIEAEHGITLAQKPADAA